ncbi:hypothetical protein Ahy_B08g091147 isoform C [Arachis hypogaea]|uniref:Uncharacterized protein n=1 Tax=Arachis hypogaea TaxID=3818 RepID=A0A444Y1G9_ARAHY|nr:hypothetical protein Ahy_B08g091147 isoform C [Arachis hypogaea]
MFDNVMLTPKQPPFVLNEVVNHDVPMSESAEHSVSTLPPLPTTSSEHKNRSTVWDHFKRTSDDENKA